MDSITTSSVCWRPTPPSWICWSKCFKGDITMGLCKHGCFMVTIVGSPENSSKMQISERVLNLLVSKSDFQIEREVSFHSSSLGELSGVGIEQLQTFASETSIHHRPFKMFNSTIRLGSRTYRPVHICSTRNVNALVRGKSAATSTFLKIISLNFPNMRLETNSKPNQNIAENA